VSKENGQHPLLLAWKRAPKLAQGREDIPFMMSDRFG